MPPKGKQGTRGQKQIVEENKSTLSFYRYILLGVNIAHVGAAAKFNMGGSSYSQTKSRPTVNPICLQNKLRREVEAILKEQTVMNLQMEKWRFLHRKMNVLTAAFFTVYFLYWEQFTTLPIMMSLTAVSLSVGSYQFMSSMARATYNQGTLVDSGVDLNMEAGMAEHLKDVILLTSIVQVAGLLSNYFWLFLLLAPARAFYLLWVNILGPWFFSAAPEQPVDDKKAKKMERKMKRLQR